MLSYTKLSGNARRFKALMGMSLQEFDLLFAKVEETHPEAERGRLSKAPAGAQSGPGAGSRSTCATACCSSCSTTGRMPPRTWRPRSSGWARPRYRIPSTRSRRSPGNASRYRPRSTTGQRGPRPLDVIRNKQNHA